MNDKKVMLDALKGSKHATYRSNITPSQRKLNQQRRTRSKSRLKQNK